MTDIPEMKQRAAQAMRTLGAHRESVPGAAENLEQVERDHVRNLHALAIARAAAHYFADGKRNSKDHELGE